MNNTYNIEWTKYMTFKKHGGFCDLKCSYSSRSIYKCSSEFHCEWVLRETKTFNMHKENLKLLHCRTHDRNNSFWTHKTHVKDPQSKLKNK